MPDMSNNCVKLDTTQHFKYEWLMMFLVLEKTIHELIITLTLIILAEMNLLLIVRLKLPKNPEVV